MKVLRFACAFAVIATGISQASPILGIGIEGTTLGCFGLGCTPVGLDFFGGLAFSGGTFSGATDTNGEFAPGVTGNNFGMFSLFAGLPFSYGTFGAPTPFTLRLILSAPTPGNGAGQDFTVGEITGVVTSPTNGTVSVTWPGICHGCGNPPVFLYNFDYLTPGDGTISVHINPLSFSLAPGSPAIQTAIQDGHFHTDVTGIVPEPGTWLMLVGALGVLTVVRRVRPSNQ